MLYMLIRQFAAAAIALVLCVNICCDAYKMTQVYACLYGQMQRDLCRNNEEIPEEYYQGIVVE